MKRTYKFVAVSTTGILMFLAGCTPPGAPPSAGQSADVSAAAQGLNWNNIDYAKLKGQTVTILWTMTGSAAKVRPKIEQAFTKETGIKVRNIGVDYNSVYNKVMTSEMSNSSDIDLAEMDTIWAGDYDNGNIAVNLSNVIPKNVQAKFTPSSLRSVEYKGDIMGVPWYSSTKHFYWNNKLLHEAGISSPPTTWDQFMTDSKIIQQKLGSKGTYASAWSWKQAESLTCDYVGFLGSFGGQFFDANGRPAFNSGGGLKALQYMTDLMKSGTVDPASLQWTEEDVMNAFAAGKIAMMSNWESMYPALNDPTQSKVVHQTDVGLLPGEGSVRSAAVTGSEGISLLKNSKHKEAALAFLKFIASREYQFDEFNDEGQYPTLRSLYSDPKVESADTTHTLGKIEAEFQYGVNRPNAPGYVVWGDILSSDIHSALMGTKSPGQALNDAAMSINGAIKSAED
ncbi:extracellular solute-binding protein [Alicyclobacillus dauci]|uniref:Extracellular solute-binding protein n=1 Tax=Alicyclobacillus dauci TaxID=1475485 RepID=A0ABY6Z0F1_9BACL|nr:extracellular solute-binding protein [Alicyclobacillus dauci]WAH36058.1 extracellular solute-binding protein [Alicyclobacillus dauci]